MRVLVADDHALLRASLCHLLASAGDMDVVGMSADGAAAVRDVLATGPDVVLMDLKMPGMGGLEAIRQIRRLSPSTRVIVLSAHAGPAERAMAGDLGVDCVLTKDVDPDILFTWLRAGSPPG